MKRSRRILTTWLLVPIAVLVLCAAQRPDNIGHRGTGSNGPLNPFSENTLPSFDQAIAEGADLVELDVTLSADGVVVVIHDDTLDRTTDCTGCVDQLTLAEIQACDAAVGTPLEGTGVTVPTLAETLDFLDGMGGVNIEIKTDSCTGIPVTTLVEAVDEVIADSDFDEPIILSSFSLSAMTHAESLDPAYVTAYLSPFGDAEEDIETAAESDLDGIHPYFLDASAGRIEQAHGLGLFINPWTVIGQPFMRLLAENGVDGIISDDPDVVAAVLDEYEWDDTDDDDDDDDSDDDNDTDDDTGDDDIDDDDDDDDDDTGDDDDAGDDDDDDDGCAA